MKWIILFTVIFAYKAGRTQNKAVSGEDFVNAVFRQVVDSSISHYYLYNNAAPCSFKKFDYDEWYKYALNEDVPVYILNELAKKSFLDAATQSWRQEKLQHACCVDEAHAKVVLASVVNQRVQHRTTASYSNAVVFYFSRPEFTDDYQYAIIDMGFRCDERQCGMGATFLFKQVNGKWIVAGRKLVWGVM